MVIFGHQKNSRQETNFSRRDYLTKNTIYGGGIEDRDIYLLIPFGTRGGGIGYNKVKIGEMPK